MLLLMFFLFLALLGGMGYAAYYQIKKTSPVKQDPSLADNIQNAQDFIPFIDIKDNAIQLGNTYRSVIEVGCLNYFLRTETEKNVIESSFARFLNSLRFPITIFIQSRALSMEQIIESLTNDLQEVLNRFPQLEAYAHIYIDGLNNMENYIGNGLNKRYYIIVPYDESESMDKLLPEERYSYAMKELYNRTQGVCEGLAACGLSARILDTKEIIELIISCYHRSDTSSLSCILGLDFARLVVPGDNPLVDKTPAEQFYQILAEAENRLTKSIDPMDLPVFLSEEHQELLNKINYLKKKIKEDKEKVGEIHNPFYEEEKEGEPYAEYDELI